MKIDFSDPTTKKVLVTILFYVIAGFVIFFLNEASPSGPCTPGPGILALLLLPVISAIRLVVNVVKVYQGNRSSRGSAMIHFVFLTGFFSFLKLNLN